MTTSHRLTGLIAAACLLGAAGCKEPGPPAKQETPAKTAPAKGAEHGHAHPHGGHGAGPHDGTLADWGGGKYHVEFTVDHAKKESTVYVLGGDEKTPSPVKAADGKLLLTIAEPSFQTELKAVPLEGESDGKASRYVGTHDNLGIVREFSGSISGEVDGTPYAGDFKEEPHGDQPHK